MKRSKEIANVGNGMLVEYKRKNVSHGASLHGTANKNVTIDYGHCLKWQINNSITFSDIVFEGNGV